MSYSKYFAIGDPQTSFARFLSILRGQDLLTPENRLKKEISLISMGDHFDFKPTAQQSLADAGRQGMLILRWLASHDPAQVRILLGNHDSCRVMELYRISDEEFQAAHRFGAKYQKLKNQRSPEAQQLEARNEFFAAFPDIPTPGIAFRDFSAFAVEQRSLIQTLLMEGRCKLGIAVQTQQGIPALLTHAGLTKEELALLYLEGCKDPVLIASHLNHFLHQRVEQAAEYWQKGESFALDLSPLVTTGRSGEEGGGFLYKRPTGKLDEWGGKGRRRFLSQDLPRGLLQVCGHTQHKKMYDLFSGHPAMTNVHRGEIRSLWYQDKIGYCFGKKELTPDRAVIWMIDGAMNAEPYHQVELLEFDGYPGGG